VPTEPAEPTVPTVTASDNDDAADLMIDIDELLDLLEDDPMQARRDREEADRANLVRILEEEIAQSAARAAKAREHRDPHSVLEYDIQKFDRQNPHVEGTREYIDHEVRSALLLASRSSKSGQALVNEMLNSALARWRERATILKQHFPDENISFPQFSVANGDDFPKPEQDAHTAFACLRILQLWHGSTAQIVFNATHQIASRIHVKKMGFIFENPINVIVFATLLRNVDGVLPFETPSKRSFLTTKSPYLKNPAILFACVVNGPVGMLTLKHGGPKLRSNARFMGIMLRYYGKQVMTAADPSLIRRATQSARAKQAIDALKLQQAEGIGVA